MTLYYLCTLLDFLYLDQLEKKHCEATFFATTDMKREDPPTLPGSWVLVKTADPFETVNLNNLNTACITVKKG